MTTKYFYVSFTTNAGDEADAWSGCACVYTNRPYLPIRKTADFIRSELQHCAKYIVINSFQEITKEQADEFGLCQFVE